MSVSIYALIDPRTRKPVYVGATRRTLSQRLYEHLYQPSNPRMARFIDELKAQELKPTVKLIERVSHENAWERELYWMAKYAKRHDLLNDMHNGRYNPSAIRDLPKIGYTKSVTVYITPAQADALHAMTTNVSAWVREKIERDKARIERKARAKASEAKS